MGSAGSRPGSPASARRRSGEPERLIGELIDPLPGAVSCSCGIILSRIKDIKGPRL